MVDPKNVDIPSDLAAECCNQEVALLTDLYEHVLPSTEEAGIPRFLLDKKEGRLNVGKTMLGATWLTKICLSRSHV